MLNARITFGNIFAMDSSIEGVETVEEDGQMFCTIDESCFVPPARYLRLGKY